MKEIRFVELNKCYPIQKKIMHSNCFRTVRCLFYKNTGKDNLCQKFLFLNLDALHSSLELFMVIYLHNFAYCTHHESTCSEEYITG